MKAAVIGKMMEITCGTSIEKSRMRGMMKRGSEVVMASMA